MNKLSIFKKGALVLFLATTALVGCSKSNDSNSGTEFQGVPYMLLTTNKPVGSNISLTIVAKEADKKDVWIDLNTTQIGRASSRERV